SAMLVQNNQVLILDAAGGDLLAYDLSGKPAGHTHLCDCFYPRGLALARDGNYWVADTGNNRVIKVSATRAVVQTVGQKGTGPGQFTEPSGVWESPQGVLFVADIGNGRVQSLKAADGTPIAAWSVGGSVARDGNRVAGDSAGHVLVSEAAAAAGVLYDDHRHELGPWQCAPKGATLTPQGLGAAGDRFVVLYLNGGVGAVFTPGK